MEFKNIRSEATLQFKAFRFFFEIVKPAREKTLSAGAEVAGIKRYFLANNAKLGNNPLFSFHQSNGLKDNNINKIRIFFQ